MEFHNKNLSGRSKVKIAGYFYLFDLRQNRECIGNYDRLNNFCKDICIVNSYCIKTGVNNV